MIPSQRILKLFFLSTILVCCVSACETKQAPDVRDIEGEYLLTGLSDRKYSYLPMLPEAEVEAIQSARIVHGRQNNSWVFEYTLPVQLTNGQPQFSYIKISQDIIWEPSLGRYYLRKLTDQELAATKWTPDDVAVEMEDGVIIFRYIRPNLACIWKKK